MKDISIQLWSVRDYVNSEGFEKTFEELSKIGYTGVEFAGCKDVPASEMKNLLDNFGLRGVGSHTGHGVLADRDSLEREMEYMEKIGVKYISCPGVSVETEDILKKHIEDLSKAAETLTRNGFIFSYHNHAHEFEAKYGGKTALDILYESTNPEEVLAELDVYWVLNAGVDPYEYLGKFNNRIKILHLKQMLDLETKAASTADKGIIDFGKIVSIASKMGCQEFVYEDETEHGDQMENARVSFGVFPNIR